MTTEHCTAHGRTDCPICPIESDAANENRDKIIRRIGHPPPEIRAIESQLDSTLGQVTIVLKALPSEWAMIAGMCEAMSRLVMSTADRDDKAVDGIVRTLRSCADAIRDGIESESNPNVDHRIPDEPPPVAANVDTRDGDGFPLLDESCADPAITFANDPNVGLYPVEGSIDRAAPSDDEPHGPASDF